MRMAQRVFPMGFVALWGLGHGDVEGHYCFDLILYFYLTGVGHAQQLHSASLALGKKSEIISMGRRFFERSWSKCSQLGLYQALVLAVDIGGEGRASSVVRGGGIPKIYTANKKHIFIKNLFAENKCFQ